MPPSQRSGSVGLALHVVVAPRGGGGSGTARRGAPRPPRRPRPPARSGARSARSSPASPWAANRSRSVFTPCGHRHDTLMPVVAVGDGDPLGERDGGVLGDAVGGVADVGQQPGGRRGGEEVALAAGEHPGSTARAANTWAITFTSQIRCHASLAASTPSFVPMPALDTSRSIGPKRSSVASTAATMSASTATSAARPRPTSPSRSATASDAAEVEVHDGDARRALGHEPLAQRATDAVGAAGDERDLAGQLHRSGLPDAGADGPVGRRRAGRHPTAAA